MSLKRFIRSITPQSVISAYHFLLALFAALWYGFPSEKMVVIGVTGTKGKSSTTLLLSRILEEAGMKIAVSSSLMFKIKENEWLNPYHMTMAGRFKLQEFLYQAQQAGCTHAIIETTSEGIRQHRHRFINFDVAVFTNLTPEHIEAHGGFENYKKAKGKLFAALAEGRHKTIAGKTIPKISVVNNDDEHVGYFAGFHADETWGFGLKEVSQLEKKSNATLVIPSAHTVDASGIIFTVRDVMFRLKLLGDFNLMNALCAITVAQSVGVELIFAKRALEKIEEVAGRAQFVREGQKFTAVIDFAHTPASFEEIFKLAQSLKKERGRVIVLFGSAGGGRDTWKRPELGKLAAHYADYIILTSDDPYEDDPGVIAHEIKSGIEAEHFQGVVEIVEDRRLAIRRAVNIARWNDLVLFLGKGTEQTMALGRRLVPWNEEGVVIEEIRNMLYDRT